MRPNNDHVLDSGTAKQKNGLAANGDSHSIQIPVTIIVIFHGSSASLFKTNAWQHQNHHWRFQLGDLHPTREAHAELS